MIRREYDKLWLAPVDRLPWGVLSDHGHDWTQTQIRLKKPGTPIVMNTAKLVIIFSAAALSACSSTYYNTMEKIGYHKRDILVDRVESARDAQSEAQLQFKSALDQFASVVELRNTDLKAAYDDLNGEYEDSAAAAEQVSQRIDKVESVADALFEEWEEELTLYQNTSLRATSARRLSETRRRYEDLRKAMRRAEQSMRPVLASFRDNVLFLKHNLNAQAIGSLQGELGSLKSEIGQLIDRMNRSINQSNRFIESLRES